MQIALKRLAQAVSRYVRKLLADLDEADEASVARFTSALAPLIEHKLTPRQSSDDGDVTDAAPIPATPTAPAAPAE